MLRATLGDSGTQLVATAGNAPDTNEAPEQSYKLQPGQELAQAGKKAGERIRTVNIDVGNVCTGVTQAAASQRVAEK